MVLHCTEAGGHVAVHNRLRFCTVFDREGLSGLALWKLLTKAIIVIACLMIVQYDGL